MPSVMCVEGLSLCVEGLSRAILGGRFRVRGWYVAVIELGMDGGGLGGLKP